MLKTQENPRFTYGDYRRWQGDERWELIDGEAFLMSPAPSTRHQRLLFRLSHQIAASLAGTSCEALFSPIDVRLPTANEADDEIATVVQPDLVVVCDPQKLDDRGVRGAPDWVVEILSPSTSVRDRVQKRDLYQRVGVREYWLIDPVGELIHVYRFDARLRAFATPTVYPQGPVPSTVLPGFHLDWDHLFAQR